MCESTLSHQTNGKTLISICPLCDKIHTSDLGPLKVYDVLNSNCGQMQALFAEAAATKVSQESF